VKLGQGVFKIGKNPAFQFYPNDWLRDTITLSPEAKGGWIDLLSKMHFNDPRGKITDDYLGFSRLFGCSKSKAKNIIQELTEKQVCDHVTNGHEKVTLINRRMDSEEKTKLSNRYRKAKQRSQESHKKVTPPSSKDTSSKDPKDTSSKKKNTEKPSTIISKLEFIFSTFNKPINYKSKEDQINLMKITQAQLANRLSEKKMMVELDSFLIKNKQDGENNEPRYVRFRDKAHIFKALLQWVNMAKHNNTPPKKEEHHAV
jgi:uncharacterized protein YdaU (DUF1376 family)